MQKICDAPHQLGLDFWGNRFASIQSEVNKALQVERPQDDLFANLEVLDVKEYRQRGVELAAQIAVRETRVPGANSQLPTFSNPRRRVMRRLRPVRCNHAIIHILALACCKKPTDFREVIVTFREL